MVRSKHIIDTENGHKNTPRSILVNYFTSTGECQEMQIKPYFLSIVEAYCLASFMKLAIMRIMTMPIGNAAMMDTV